MVARVRAVRDAVGPDVEILVEVHRRLSPQHAIRVARRMEPCRPFWFEEPVSARDASDVVGELEMSAFQDWSARLGIRWDPENTQTVKSEVGLQYRPASNRVVNAGYRLQRDSIEQLDMSVAWPIGDSWRGFGRNGQPEGTARIQPGDATRGVSP